MGILAAVLAFLLLRIVTGTGTNKHLVCKEFSDDVTDRQANQMFYPWQNQGRQGKIGPKGHKGESAIVDYDLVNDVIERGIREKMRPLELEIAHMRKTMNQTISELTAREDRLDWCNNHNGIEYNGTCLWAAAGDAPKETPLPTALRICNEIAPSKLPDIYGEVEYRKIMDYLRSKIPTGNTYHFAWTGMFRDHSTGRAVLSSGDLAPYTKPRTRDGEWINAVATRTNAFLIVRNTQNTDQGMGSTGPSFGFPQFSKSVLCQKI